MNNIHNARLGELIRIKKGKKPLQISDRINSDKHLPYLLIESMEGQYKLFTDDSSCPIAKKEDTLLVWDGARSGLSSTGQSGYVGSTLAVISKKSEIIDSRYLFYFISSKQKQIHYSSEGTGIPHVSRMFLENLQIPIPPLPEQKKIAEILSGIDKVISKYVLKLNKEYLIAESIMESIEESCLSYKVPKVKIGDISTKVGSGITPRGGSDIYVKKGVKLIRSQNVLKMKLSLSNVVHIPPSIHSQMHNSSIKKGDTLLNITGASIGRSSVVPDDLGEANVNQHVCIIRTKEICDPYFLSAWFNSQGGQRQINISQAGGNRQGLNFQEIRSMSFPLHSLEFQRKVSDAISKIYKLIDNTERKISQLQNLKSGISSDLLLGRKRINI